MARENWDAYVADEYVCHACAARDRRVAGLRENKHADTDGLKFAVRMVDESAR